MKSLPAILVVIFVTTAAITAEPGYYTRTIFADDFSGNAFGPRWGHYKSSSVVKDGMLIGITALSSTTHLASCNRSSSACA